MIQKIRDGAMGDINLIRAFRMSSGGGSGPFKAGENELLWQIRRAYHCLWSTSGVHVGNLIHQIDECCWIKDA